MNTLRAENYVKDMADALRSLVKAARGRGKRNSTYVEIHVDPTLTDEQLEGVMEMFKETLFKDIKYGNKN